MEVSADSQPDSGRARARTFLGGHHAFAAAIVVLFLCRALAANSLIPIWQGPDEPTHFVVTRLLSAPGQDRVELEGRILASMARHGWWTAYREPTPDPVPRSFAEVRGHLADNVPRGSLGLPAYYVVGAAALRLAPSMDLESQYMLLRAVSLILSIAALLCGWAGTRLLFGDAVGAAAVSIAALHPQFLLSALSVNPDALVNLCGAVMWWQAAVLHQEHGRRPAIPLLLIAGAAVVAIFSKRNGAPLGVIALALAAIAAWPYLRTLNRRRAMTAAAAALAAAAVVLFGIAAWYPSLVQQAGDYWRNAIIVRRSPAMIASPQGYEFLKSSIDTAWLVAGWLRFPAPEWWLWITRVMTLAGLLGAFYAWLRRGSLARPMSLAWMFVALQVVPLVVLAFLLLSVPQGRYLFAVFMPVSTLLVVGIHSCVPARARVAVLAVLVVAFASLDAIGLASVLIPAYS